MLASGAIRDDALKRSISSTGWVTHSGQVMDDASALARSIADAQSAERGYLLSHDANDLRSYEAAIGNFWSTCAALQTLVADNPPQVLRAIKIGILFESWRTEVAEPTIRRAAETTPDTAVDEQFVNRIQRALDEFILIERGFLRTRSANAAGAIVHAQMLSTVGSALTIAVTLLVALYLSISVGRAVTELAAAAHELTHGNLARRALVGRRDEIGRLSHSFNLMADGLIERTEDAARLAKLGEEFQSCLTIQETGLVFARFAMQVLPEAVGAMYLLSASRNLLVKSFDWGRTELGTLPPEDCLALRKGHAHYVNDTSVGGACSHVSVTTNTASACIPLMAHGETVGLLHVQAPAGQHEPLRRTFVGAVAEQLALTVANLQLREKLYSQSIRDPLTGLFNRRYLDETLPRELARAERSGRPLGVFAIDVDHFKRFNDTFGHDAGDTVLRQLGELLRLSFRGSDISARLGGEEFLVVLPEIDEGKLVRRAERLGDAVRGLAFKHRDLSLGTVTVSIGIAIFPQSSGEVEGLLRAADAALYKAKHEGRDRAVVAEKSAGHQQLSSLAPSQRA